MSEQKRPGIMLLARRPSYTDLVFVLNGERFELHRAVLAARSPYYHRMLQTAWAPTPVLHSCAVARCVSAAAVSGEGC